MVEEARRPFFTVERPMKYALFLAAVFIVPIVNTWLMYGGTITAEDVSLSAIASLVLVNPLAATLAGATYAWRHGFLMLLPWLFGLAFIPAALIAYNETALPFGMGYVVFGYLGQGLGLLGRRLRERTSR